MTDFHFSSASLERFILSYLLKDKPFFLQVAQYLTTNDYLKKSYFIDSKLQWMLNFAHKYYEKYNKVPSLETVKILIETKFKSDPALAKSMELAAEEIYTKDLSSMEAEYLQEETKKFIKTARSVEATLQNQLDITNGKFDELADRMQKAVNINLDKNYGLSLANAKRTLPVIQQAEEDTGMSFGTPAMDRILGSPRRGELVVYCGTPGIGKTIWLGNVAVANFRQHKKGVFFSMEVDERRLAKRLYSTLLLRNGVDISKINPEEAEMLMADYPESDIRIKQFPARSASCNDFAAYLMDLAATENYVPDYIVIDYILITAANNKGMEDNTYNYYKAVAEEMRNLGSQFGCPVFTAAQINRNGMGDKGGTKAVVTAKDLSESRGILDTADYLFIIQQTDQEKKMGEKDGVAEQRLFVDKSRNSSGQQVLNFTINYNTMSVSDGKKARTV